MSRALLLFLAGYKRLVSPFLPRSCRFTPSCSEYAALAIRTRGPWVGSVMALGRIARCQPFSAGGLDLPSRRRSHGASHP